MTSRYTLEEQLGKGGMGVVYRALDRLEGKPVALKRIEVDPVLLELNPAAVWPRYQHHLLGHEFSTLAALRHPNIISVLDYGFDTEQHPFFVMELIESPRTIVQAAQMLDERGKFDLLIQMLQAIQYLHHHRILHRDLKPNNVLVNQAGQVKVLDFGLAVKAGDHQDQAGTIHYMAPEVINFEGAIEASDLFAVGVMAYELFTGSRPFKGLYHSDIAEQILNAAPDMSYFDQSVSADSLLRDLSPVISRLLAKKPRDRYPDALATIRAFCQAAGEALPPDEGPIRESFLQAAPFVGREDELDELNWALSEAKAGRGSLWLVGGESGIGKSRLLDELRIHALTEAVSVLRGQVTEGGDSLARTWTSIVRPLMLSVKVSQAEINAPDNLTDQSGPLIVELFSRVNQPTLLIMEDLQWAGASLDLLNQLRLLLDNLPILVVGSFRSDEAPDLPHRLPNSRFLRLEQLSAENVRQLIVSMLGDAGSDPVLVERIVQETEGNAFFIVEVMRAWAEQAGRLSEIGNVELPQTVLTGGMRQVVQRRLKRVPDWAYGGLQVAAVGGRALNLAVLDRILSPLLGLLTGEKISVSISTVWRENRGLNLDDWLLVCADAAILAIQDGSWRFTHDKLREQLLADLDADQMQMLQRQIEKASNALRV